MKRVSETLGQRVRRVRYERGGMSASDLARAMDVSPVWISRLETDTLGSVPSEMRLRQIADILGDDLDELLHLAGHVPSDIAFMILNDPDLPRLLRAIKAAGVPAKRVAELLGLWWGD